MISKTDYDSDKSYFQPELVMTNSNGMNSIYLGYINLNYIGAPQACSPKQLQDYSKYNIQIHKQ